MKCFVGVKANLVKIVQLVLRKDLTILARAPPAGQESFVMWKWFPATMLLYEKVQYYFNKN